MVIPYDWRVRLLAKSPKWLTHIDNPTVTEDHPYLHWESVAQLTPPKKLKPRTWWMLIKLRRAARFVPLSVTPQCSLQYFVTSSMFAKLRDLDAQLGPHSTFVKHLAKFQAQALTSEALACSQRSEPHDPSWLWSETEPLAEDQIQSWKAFQVLRWLVNHAHEPLTPSIIFKLHNQLLEDTQQETQSQPCPKGSKSELNALCAFANNTEVIGYLHPWIRNIAVRFWFSQATEILGPASVQLGHLISYWSALRNGWPGYQLLPLSQTLQIASKRHSRAMEQTLSDELDLNYILLDQLEVLTDALARAKAHLDSADDYDQKALPNDLPEDLNPRQRTALAHAYRSPKVPITISAHQHLHGIVYQTARTDLLGLVDHDLLECTQAGKRFVFTLASRK